MKFQFLKSFSRLDHIGLFARYDTTIGEDGTGYVIGISNKNGSQTAFGIHRFGSSHAVLAESLFVPDPAKTYNIEFELQGTSLTGRLTDVATGVIVTRLNVTDATYSSGKCGFEISTKDHEGTPDSFPGSIEATVDDFKIETMK